MSLFEPHIAREYVGVELACRAVLIQASCFVYAARAAGAQL